MPRAVGRGGVEVGNGPAEEGRKDLGRGLARGGGQRWRPCLPRARSGSGRQRRFPWWPTLSFPFYPTIHLPNTWRLSHLRRPSLLFVPLLLGPVVPHDFLHEPVQDFL